MLFPKDGSIAINGFDPRKRKPSFLETVYFLPEEVNVPALTIKGYLNLFSPFYPRFDENLFYRALAVLEVKTLGKLTTLSFGQQKKFAIAFALACNTKVLLLDEPTNGMDIPSKTQFRKLISADFTRSRMLLISTHQVRDLDNLIDQVIIVDGGRLLLHTSMEEITEKLCFKTVHDLPAEPDGLLYAEPSLKGISVVMKNLDNEDSKINLEHLFNAVTEQPAKTKDIFAH